MNNKKTKKLEGNVRYTALETIERIDHGGAYSNILLNEMIQKATLNPLDSRLYTEMVYGTISRKLLLEYYLSPFTKKAKKVFPWVKNLLILSIYQLLYLNKVPDHAVIHEAVEIAKIRGNLGVGKFVNGVLRSIQRQGVPSLSEISDPIARLATEISMPLWLVNKLIKQIGAEEARKLGLSLYDKSRVSGRVDTRVLSIEETIVGLSQEEIVVKASDISPYGVVAEKGFLAGSQLYKDGKITVQDESSMLVAPTMNIQPDHLVLDACAAPGGKTTHIATFLDEKLGGHVIALDIHQHKIKLITENAQRMHVQEMVKTEQLDARKAGKYFPKETFDRVLVDAPCSGLGLMRRKPDIKYHKQPEDFQKLPKIQLDILESVAPTLKPLGLLIYSTCTIAEEENHEVVASFLKKHPEFKKIDVLVGENLKSAVEDQMLVLYPHQFQTDGFFICCMQKVC